MLSQVGLLCPIKAGAAPQALLEDLRYRMDVLIIEDAARGRLTLTAEGGGRFLAELSGEARGLAEVLSGRRRDRYQTEMVYRDGRLVPLIYREESHRRGKQSLKEYRFDYEQGRLELWQLKEREGHLVLKWETALKEPVYDPLSAFYNCRLGLMGPLKEGNTLQIAGIPYPAPETMEVRLGKQTPEGRQAMVTLNNPALKGQRGVVFIMVDGDGVPLTGWTRVLGFGKALGQLLPESKPLRENCLEIKRGQDDEAQTLPDPKLKGQAPP